MTRDEALKGWTKEIYEGYIELGQKVMEEKDFKELKQYYETGIVTGKFDSDTTSKEIEFWLTSLAVMVNGRTNIQIAVDNLVVANMKKFEEEG